MTNVTALTMELVEQFEFAVGRRVTATEYMELRKQAILELSAGYSFPETKSNIMRPVMSDSKAPSTNNSALNYAQMNNDINDVIMKANSAVSMMPPDDQTLNQVPPVPVVANLASKLPAPIAPSANVTATEKQGVIQMMPIDSTTTADNENNDFFKLVGKFM